MCPHPEPQRLQHRPDLLCPHHLLQDAAANRELQLRALQDVLVDVLDDQSGPVNLVHGAVPGGPSVSVERAAAGMEPAASGVSRIQGQHLHVERAHALFVTQPTY